MVTFVVRLADLKFLSPSDWSGERSDADVVEKLRREFAYLPGELRITIQDGVATIQLEEAPDTKRTEARRLLDKAAKRAKAGEFQKARDIYRSVLELDPALVEARRDLAMSLYELGDMESAKDELVDALRLDPNDGWNYVVLGNIYLKHDRDFATAARFFSRALELKPHDPYALNGLAAASQYLGDSAKAFECFDEAIEKHPEFANAWLGKAILLYQLNRAAEVTELLAEMFDQAEIMDARSQPVFAEARRLYLNAQARLAEEGQSPAFKALETYKAEVSELSGFAVEVHPDPALGRLSGIARMAWKHGRDHHIVQVNEKLAPPRLSAC